MGCHQTDATKTYTLSLHDALPISSGRKGRKICTTWEVVSEAYTLFRMRIAPARDRKSTRLNSSHVKISYAVFCLKKKIRRPPFNSLLAILEFDCTIAGYLRRAHVD